LFIITTFSQYKHISIDIRQRITAHAFCPHSCSNCCLFRNNRNHSFDNCLWD